MTDAELRLQARDMHEGIAVRVESVLDQVLLEPCVVVPFTFLAVSKRHGDHLR